MNASVTTLRRIRGERRPGDSGEYRAVPSQFRFLAPGRTLPHARPRLERDSVWAAAFLMPLAQAFVMACGVFALADLIPGNGEKVAFVVGPIVGAALPAALSVLLLARGRMYRAREIVFPMIVGQVSWLASLLMGLWGLLVLCIVPQAIVGTILGSLIGCTAAKATKPMGANL